MQQCRVSVQGVQSLDSHFACLCQEFDFYEAKKKKYYHFSKRKGKYFYNFNILYSESLQKEQNSSNLLPTPK